MGALSRNKDIGVRLARGRSLENLLEDRMSVAEGVKTAKAVKELAERHSVDMPIVQAMNAIMYEDKDPRHTIFDRVRMPRPGSHGNCRGRSYPLITLYNPLKAPYPP